MSLVKHPTLTPQKLEANQANARLSQGPATTEGIERIREAQLVHGFYSKATVELMRALGEKPDDFERLLGSLNETWQPENDYELVLVRRLARALWRVERADRIQEAMTVHQVERVTLNVDELSEKDAASHKAKTAVLERLLEQAQQIGFCATLTDLHDLEDVVGDHPKGRPGEILYRVWRLMKPSDPGVQKLADQMAREVTEQVADQVADQAEDQLGEKAAPARITPDHAVAAVRSGIAPATGEERGRLRAELRSLVRQEIEAQQVAYRQQRDRRAREITPAGLDAAMAPNDPRADFMLRSEAAAFRQVKEITAMLLRFQERRRPGRPEQAAPDPEVENDGKSHDVVENKGPS